MLGLADVIKHQIPENIDYDQTVKILSVDPSPLNVVLLQEVRLLKCTCTLLTSLLTLFRSSATTCCWT